HGSRELCTNSVFLWSSSMRRMLTVRMTSVSAGKSAPVSAAWTGETAKAASSRHATRKMGDGNIVGPLVQDRVAVFWLATLRGVRFGHLQLNEVVRHPRTGAIFRPIAQLIFHLGKDFFPGRRRHFYHAE